MDFLTQATVLAAASVLLVHEILKLNIVPVTFANRYPVPTNIVLSVIATVFTIRWTGVAFSWHNWAVLARTFGLVAVGAAVAYNQLLGRSQGLKTAEGQK